MEGSSSDGRCALAAELAQVLQVVRQLEAHLGGGGVAVAAPAAGADERCRALVSSMRSSIDKSISIARSCCVEGRPMLPADAGTPESPPSADGSAGSDHGSDSRCRANATGQCKKRKTLPKWSTQVRVRSVQDVGSLDDGLSWRKYGQKDILGAKYPRSYFRCTHRHTQGCHASKQVQRADGDPLLFDIVYHGNHTCAQAAARSAASVAEPPQPPPQTAQEQIITVAAEGVGGVTQALEPMLRPFSFTSTAAGTDEGGVAGALHQSCVSTASPFMSPATTTSECQVYELGGGSESRPRNVPDIEFASKTNSSMGADMEFMLQLDPDFFDNPGYF
ncbi:hypothetical protein GUJ93_ZPchr0007g4507 [Zizania palustris]|uniref:WRKY domain-containing protein n=1 Tax=Zizania palustris TaxID=103762 RepID=A0A8J5VR24_ZIZPA|nr:hypothetical protein GUJ93_ZPchr0007g4507 [Zizania palustris]